MKENLTQSFIECLNNKDLIMVSRLYAEVFAAPPWNEVWLCKSCNTFYGLDFNKEASSPCCSKPLQDAYPEKETCSYIRKEILKPEARISLSFGRNSQLVGFAWGYKVEPKILATEKWSKSEITQREVLKIISEEEKGDNPLYYISEVGVSFPFRGNGTGFKLTESLMKVGLDSGKAVVFRTNWASPMMLIAQKLGMSQIMGPMVQLKNNEIVKTGDFKNFIDEINPDRTLFIKTP